MILIGYKAWLSMWGSKIASAVSRNLPIAIIVMRGSRSENVFARLSLLFLPHFIPSALDWVRSTCQG